MKTPKHFTRLPINRCIMLLMQIILFGLASNVYGQGLFDSVPRLTPNGIFDVVRDKDGRQFALANLNVGSGKRIGGGNQINAVTNTCVAGYFTLHFEGNSNVFANQDARTMMCQVFTDISAMINSSAAPGLLHIYCTMTTNTANLGVASEFYIMPSNQTAASGIIDGQIYKGLTTGQDPYLNLPMSLIYSAAIIPNSNQFYSGFVEAGGNFQWNFNPTITPIPNNEVDFYTVMLHEVGHALGFASLIGESGHSKFNGPNITPANYDFYSRYDRFLQSNYGTPLLTVTNPTSVAFAHPTTSVIAPGMCTTTLSQNNTFCPNAAVYWGSVIRRVYTPNCFESGSSLSHFEDQCFPVPGYTTSCTGPSGSWNDLLYVMSNANGDGPCYVKRHFEDAERQVFCDLGYSLNATYGSSAVVGTSYTYAASCSPSVNPIIGLNDGIQSNIYTFTTSTNSLVIPTSSILINDIPSTGLDVNFLTSLTPNTSAILGATDFTVTAPQGAGYVVLQYFPRNIATNQYGNPTYISVYFVPQGCLTCNMVRNGGFEYHQSPGVPDCGAIDNTRRLDCWDSYHQGAQLFSTSCDNVSSSFELGNPGCFILPSPTTVNIGQTANTKCVALLKNNVSSMAGAIKNTLNGNLTNGNVYNVSMWVMNRANSIQNASTNPLNTPVVISVASYSTVAFTATANFPTGLNVVSSFTIPAANVWTHVTHTFTYTNANPATALVVGIDNLLTTPPPPGLAYYVLLDEISINPLPTPSLSIPPMAVCAGSSMTNLAQYASTTGTFSGAEVTYSGSQYHFNASGNAAPGIHSIAFTYTNGACLNTIYASITVTNCCNSLSIPTHIGNNFNATPSITGPYRIANNATVTSGNTLNLSGEIIFGTNTKLVVSSTASLYINNAHLYSCGNAMWEGIEVQDGGYISVTNTGNGDNLIEDAIVAISTDQMTSNASNILEVSNTTFNKNYKDIRISNYVSATTIPYPFKIDNCVFTCRELPFTQSSWPQTGHSSTSSNVFADLRHVFPATPTTGLIAPYLNHALFDLTNLKNPYSNQRSQVAIELNNIGIIGTGTTGATAITIGSDANVNDFNLFDSHWQFINATNSDVKLLNNVFQRGQTYTITVVTPAPGIAHVKGSAIVHNTNGVRNTELLMTANNSNISNRFWGCYTAVEGKNTYRFWMENAIIRASAALTTTDTPQGIQMTTNRFDYYIHNNEFTNLTTGINIPIASGAYTLPPGYNPSPTFIYYNPGIFAMRLRINANRFISTTPTSAQFSTVSDAITVTGVNNTFWHAVVNNSVSPESRALAVTGNTLSEVFRGIYINGITGFPTIIENNRITLKQNGSLHHGIKLTSTTPALVGSQGGFGYGRSTIAINTVSFVASPTNTNSTLIFCGHNGYSPQSPSVTCNELYAGTRGFVFDGPQIGTFWGGNDIQPMAVGLTLSNNGKIGTQGGTTFASSNLWDGTWISGLDHTYVDLSSNASYSKLYITNSGGYIPASNNGPVSIQTYAQGGNLLPATGGGYNCSGIPNNKPIGVPENTDDFLSEEMFYMEQQDFYHFLHGNDSVRSIPGPTNDFYTAAAAASLGKLVEIEELLYQNDYVSARDKLTDLGPGGNAVEVNYKSFYNVYANYIENGILDEDDSTRLYTLAMLCPGSNGRCVYQGQALYNTIYHKILNSDCGSGDDARKAYQNNNITPNIKSRFNIELFPNPAKDLVTIKNSQENGRLNVSVKDLSGRIVFNTVVEVKAFIANLEINLLNGAYLILITNSKNEQITKKLLIAK